MRKAVNAQIIVIHLPKATKANLLSESNSSRIKRHLAFFKYITIFRLVAPVVQWIGHNPAKIVTPVRLRVGAICELEAWLSGRKRMFGVHVYGQLYLGFESLSFRKKKKSDFRFFLVSSKKNPKSA